MGVRSTGEVERSGALVDLQDLDRDNLGLTLFWNPRSMFSRLEMTGERR